MASKKQKRFIQRNEDKANSGKWKPMFEDDELDDVYGDYYDYMESRYQ